MRDPRAAPGPRPVLFWCAASQIDRERFGFARAFARLGVPVATLELETAPGEELAREQPFGPTPRLILWPDAGGVPPARVLASNVPTACFHIDTFEDAPRRIATSMLFDYACLFHPRFLTVWERAGHPRPILVPHAVDPDPFAPRGEPRRYDVGWVGQADHAFYAARRRLLPRLATRFSMNEWNRPHSYGEMAEVYRCSKIVVNISRDDYPEDANLRLFEAMASGALLVTLLPTEAEELGLVTGEHFVGYRHDDELLDVLAHYLAHDDDRARIAEAGRAAVLREHTYERRAADLLATVAADGGRLFAPARRWSASRTSRAHLGCHADAHLWDPLRREFGRLARMSPWAAIQALPLVLRELVWRWRLRLRVRERVTGQVRAAAAALGGLTRGAS